jgi:rare lipoprotein A
MSKRKRIHLRWAVSLATAAIALLAVAPAQAATGGAASFTATTTTAAAPGQAGLAFSPMRYGGASWYGPGLWGNSTACGQILRPATLGVAHKKLRCGTTVKFMYHGRTLVTRVIDRGPYIRGRAWDLTEAAKDVLGFEGVGRVRYAIAIRYARP